MVAIFGLLLTIKHNFLENTKSPLNYIHSINGTGALNSLEFETNIKYYKEAKKVAYEETWGFVLTILGTLVNCFGGFIPVDW